LTLCNIAAAREQLTDIVLINPRFEISFWGFEFVLPFVGKRANMPVEALPLLAALTPPGDHVTIIDLSLQRGPRPEQSDQGAPDQPANIAHRERVSADSRSRSAVLSLR
jgi:hypothetical protein